MPFDSDAALKRLRKYLNPSIRGQNTDIVLETLSKSVAVLDYNTKAINDQCYISTASVQYLDNRLSDYGLTRPSEVGVLDETFRQIGIAIINRKQVRDLVNQILKIAFGDDTTEANMVSAVAEPYVLQDQDQLRLRYDDGEIVTITFKTQDFSVISSATAQEVADAITKQLRQQNKTGRAFAQDNGGGAKVYLITDTIGSRGSVAVYGGRAQDVLRFPLQRNITPDVTTQWDIEKPATGKTRFVWTGGADPSLGVISVGDYVNIYGLSFDPQNRGTFTVTKVDVLATNPYIEFENLNSITESAVGAGVTAFKPQKTVITDQIRYAVQFQSEANVLEIFIPATTRVVRRSRKGAAYLQDRGFSTDPDFGPYVYDPTSKFSITGVQSILSQPFGPNQGNIITVQTNEAEAFPDQSGFIVLGYGSSNQEGPIPYIARPSDSTILLSPAYVVKNNHPAKVAKTTGADGTTVVNLTKDSEGIMVLESVGGTPFSFLTNGIQAGDILTLGSIFDPTNQKTFGIRSVTATSISFEYFSGAEELGVILGSPSQVSISSAGTDVALVNLGPYAPQINANDYQFFNTDNVSGRIYTEELLQSIVSAGVILNFTIIYPNPIGLGSWEEAGVGNEKRYIWGRDYSDVYEV